MSNIKFGFSVIEYGFSVIHFQIKLNECEETPSKYKESTQEFQLNLILMEF